MAKTQKPGPIWEGKLDRRLFLKGTVGTAAALVFHSALQLDVEAQRNIRRVGLNYFNQTEALTVESIAERIWPATDGSPGAREAGVVVYIDRALAGEYERYRLQYRVGLDAINQVSQQRHETPFYELDGGQQDSLLMNITGGEEIFQPQPREGLEGEPPVPEDLRQEIARLGRPNLQEFFNLVRTHTMEGLFADPIYGGNRDFAGWRAVGYPGPYYLYTADEQQKFEPLDKPQQSLRDI